jgi:hypothetical protein
MTKMTVTFRNFMNAPKISLLHVEQMTEFEISVLYTSVNMVVMLQARTPYRLPIMLKYSASVNKHQNALLV